MDDGVEAVGGGEAVGPRGDGGDAVDAEGPQTVAEVVVADDVPTAGVEDHAVGAARRSAPAATGAAASRGQFGFAVAIPHGTAGLRRAGTLWWTAASVLRPGARPARSGYGYSAAEVPDGDSWKTTRPLMRTEPLRPSGRSASMVPSVL